MILMLNKIVISNAFSLNMIPSGINHCLYWIKERTLDEVKVMLSAANEIASIVGHEDTARVFSDVLGVTVEYNRTNYTMDIEGFAKSVSGGTDSDTIETLIVGQYSGPRLQEGATTLPEGATIKWFDVGFYWNYDAMS